MNEAIQNMLTRRSCRKFDGRTISDEELELILEAGKYAPTGANRQDPVMVVVQKPETIKKLSAMNAAIAGMPPAVDPFYGATTVIVVLAERGWMTALEDGSLCMGNLLNAAASLGIGSCWIYRAREEFDSDEGKALLKEWGIEGDYIGVGHCILGYPAAPAPEAAPRKANYVTYVR